MQPWMSIANLTGDKVLYRDLQPGDPTMCGLADVRKRLEIPSGVIPRKRDADYARVVATIIAEFQTSHGHPSIQTALVIGDTDNDRWVAEHLRTLGVPTFCFIGLDRLIEPPTITWEAATAYANRWALLPSWLSTIEAHGIRWQATALLIDIDKTLLGPRGRCDQAIDDSRLAGAMQVAAELIGATLDFHTFGANYAHLCQSPYQQLTLDNQDYVVYLCLLVATNTLTLEAVQLLATQATPQSFRQLLATTASQVPSLLRDLHAELRAADTAGDPTPFKRFRQAEFAATIARMRAGRLTLCHEVVAITHTLRERGVLCVAASDKPTEAALPVPTQVAAGLTPLHHTLARVDS